MLKKTASLVPRSYKYFFHLLLNSILGIEMIFHRTAFGNVTRFNYIRYRDAFHLFLTLSLFPPLSVCGAVATEKL